MVLCVRKEEEKEGGGERSVKASARGRDGGGRGVFFGFDLEKNGGVFFLLSERATKRAKEGFLCIM